MILIANDDRVSQTIIKRNLKTAGYDVRVTHSSSKVLDIIKKHDIRILILDWIGTNIDGEDICMDVRGLNLPRDIHIIIMIAKNQKKDLPKAFKAGADDYIFKPFDTEELIPRIKLVMKVIEFEDKYIQSKRELIRFSKEDPLTNLLNRRALLDEIIKEVDRASREHRIISTILVDIDAFKDINELYGNQAGDNILIEVARRLQSVCRPYDKVGRYSGEEFLVLLPNTRTSNAVKIAKRMYTEISQRPFKLMDDNIDISVSFGISLLAPDNRQKDIQLDSLIKRTEVALTRAKQEGKNRIVVNVES